MMWNKDGSQNTDLHSSNYGDTKVLGLSGTTQVGIGTDADDVVHALLWHGTASSVVDLQPANWDSTWAYGASDHGQVGSGYSGTLFGNGSKHALYWNGSASSMIDFWLYLLETEI